MGCKDDNDNSVDNHNNKNEYGVVERTTMLIKIRKKNESKTTTNEINKKTVSSSSKAEKEEAVKQDGGMQFNAIRQPDNMKLARQHCRTGCAGEEVARESKIDRHN